MILYLEVQSRSPSRDRSRERSPYSRNDRYSAESDRYTRDNDRFSAERDRDKDERYRDEEQTRAII